MSRRISQQQLEVMDALEEGAIIHAYRSYDGSGPGLRAFISGLHGQHSSKTIRVSTLFALYEKKVIVRQKKLDWDDWAGIWTLAK